MAEKEYIEREAVLKAYLDLVLAKSKAEKSKKGAATFQGDLFPMVELTEKEWVRLINAAPAADVAPVVHGRWLPQIVLGQRAWDCSECKTLGSPHWKRCPVCEAKMDLEGGEG